MFLKKVKFHCFSHNSSRSGVPRIVCKMMFRALYVASFLLSCFETNAIRVSRKDVSPSAIMTIETEYGDIYECIDFYKQPTFNHPLLKNHSFHPGMRPSSRPKWIQNNDFSLSVNERPADVILLKDGGCPPGTVPIRRGSDKDNISQIKNHLNHSAERVNPNGGTEYISGTVYALGQTKSNPWKNYYGVGGVFSIYNPRVFPSQYSSGEIIIKSGGDSIIAGWTVNPSKYKDNLTRFFIYAVAGDLHCFNSECGFIIVRSDIPLDFVMHPISKRGGPIFVNKFFIYQEKVSGNWWLEVAMYPPIAVGFWPNDIFEGLKRSATYAACGGEINTIATLPPPEMGAGAYPDFAPAMNMDAYCTDFVVVNENYTVVDAADTEAYANNPNYGAFDVHMRGKSKKHVVTFGGP
ncbi:unnamed protein product [Amaranthus hypochondriacus]